MNEAQYVRSLLNKDVSYLNYDEANFLLSEFEESLTVDQFREISEHRDHLED